MFDFLGVDHATDFNPSGFDDATVVKIETTDDGDARRLPTVQVTVPTGMIVRDGVVFSELKVCPECPEHGRCDACGLLTLNIGLPSTTASADEQPPRKPGRGQQ